MKEHDLTVMTMQGEEKENIIVKVAVNVGSKFCKGCPFFNFDDYYCNLFEDECVKTEHGENERFRRSRKCVKAFGTIH